MRGRAWASPRGLGDFRVQRDLLDASPRQRTSEMLSAAPGFFVDHEDGEGVGNDVYLRGFDLDHGSGIEMRVGSIPINNPLHIQGQGYADANFIIPEVVRSIRVLEGPFDPRQGDAAIVGSAYFDLGSLSEATGSAPATDRLAKRDWSPSPRPKKPMRTPLPRSRFARRTDLVRAALAFRHRRTLSTASIWGLAIICESWRRPTARARSWPEWSVRTTSMRTVSASTTRTRTSPRVRECDLRV